MENEREEGPTGLEDYGILIHDQETVQLPRNLMEPLQSTRPRFAPESVVLWLMIRLASIGGTGVGRRLWGKGFAISTRRLLRPVGRPGWEPNFIQLPERSGMKTITRKEVPSTPPSVKHWPLPE